MQRLKLDRARTSRLALFINLRSERDRYPSLHRLLRSTERGFDKTLLRVLLFSRAPPISISGEIEIEVCSRCEGFLEAAACLYFWDYLSEKFFVGLVNYIRAIVPFIE